MVTVLVVEDELLVRLSIVQDLVEEGLQVLEAANADQAVAILETRHDIHLLFTDVDMPGSMDGLKLAAFVRDRWPPVEIIVTSGKNAFAKLPPRAVFVPKPYRTPHIVETIKSLTTWEV